MFKIRIYSAKRETTLRLRINAKCTEVALHAGQKDRKRPRSWV